MTKVYEKSHSLPPKKSQHRAAVDAANTCLANHPVGAAGSLVHTGFLQKETDQRRVRSFGAPDQGASRSELVGLISLPGLWHAATPFFAPCLVGTGPGRRLFLIEKDLPASTPRSVGAGTDRAGWRSDSVEDGPVRRKPYAFSGIERIGLSCEIMSPNCRITSFCADLGT